MITKSGSAILNTNTIPSQLTQLSTGGTLLQLTESELENIVSSNLSGLGGLLGHLGLVLILMGFVAWMLHNPRSYRSQWGRRLFAIGIGYTIISYNRSGFWSLVNYVIGG